MTRLMMLLSAWLGAMAFVVAANPARAAGSNDISYVSNTGNDGNTCATPATACASFFHALSETANYGEIDCLNAGNYGATVIAQSVTIDCAGGVGFSASGFTINGTSIVVRLRNLTINRGGLGGFSVDAQNMAALYIENCVITNANAANAAFAPYLGIKFEPSASAQLFVTNSVISDNGNFSGGAGGGIAIVPSSGALASVTLDGVKLLGNVYGIGLNSGGGTIVGALRHSIISGSNISGLVATGGGSPLLFTVEASSIMNNLSYGILTNGSGVNLQIGGSTISGNQIGVSGPGIVSFKNNQIGGNGSDGTPLAAFPGPGGTPLQ
jgi:hypothetical protein